MLRFYRTVTAEERRRAVATAGLGALSPSAKGLPFPGAEEAG
jgi:hypothetical protein